MQKRKRPTGSFDDFRQLYFEEIAEDRAKLFNFFFENNDIFKSINDEDTEKLIVLF